jgi:cyanophycinase
VVVSSPGAADAGSVEDLMGPIALHGGGEFLPGDERFLDALLGVAARAAAARRAEMRDRADLVVHAAGADPIRVLMLPTAAARGRPDLAAANGREAFGRRAGALGCRISVETALVVDAASAADEAEAARIAAADLVYLPGGDPDLTPSILARSAVGAALAAAHDDGAVIAGASAGAMALAEWSWTKDGGIRGLGFIHGLAVVPHYDDVRRLAWQANLAMVAPDGLGYLGLDERTGVISEEGRWRVAGEGAAHWFAPGSSLSETARDGGWLAIPARPGVATPGGSA